MFASITARRLNRDPEPWVYPDGTRHSALPALDLQTVTGEVRDVSPRADYTPRAEYVPAQRLAANPILDDVRDVWDDDVWGTTLSWSFPCASVLDYLGEYVPDAYGYRASFAGAAGDLSGDVDWATAMVVTALGLGTHETDYNNFDRITLTPIADLEPGVVEQAAAYAAHALAVLSRLGDLVPESERY